MKYKKLVKIKLRQSTFFSPYRRIACDVFVLIFKHNSLIFRRQKIGVASRKEKKKHKETKKEREPLLMRLPETVLFKKYSLYCNYISE